MNSVELKSVLQAIDAQNNETVNISLCESIKVKIYPKSIIQSNNVLFFLGKEKYKKYLYLIDNSESSLNTKFDGEQISDEIKRCEMTTKNREVLQSIFEFLNPTVIGLNNSFGFGDRIGLANPGHLRSLGNSGFKPILAQQSIRELTRTSRTPQEVMDAAVWAVFQEGYKEGFGADGDHLKTEKDIDLLINAGYKMFTFDPSDYVDNEADNYNENQLSDAVSKLPWDDLEYSLSDAQKHYLSKEIRISDKFKITPISTELFKAYAKYGKAIAHIKNLYHHIQTNYSNYDYEIEVSVDETESVTTPFEHFFFASELNRLGIKFISLAPRFIGDFEKGIDYKGDLKIFKEEYEKHLAITKYFGNYKISLHSGSDKFSVYKVIGSISDACTHVKTAGTSYLEALKVTALKDPELFRDILDCSRILYQQEKKTYHVSADIDKLKPSKEYGNEELAGLFDSNDIRQILHVTFGKILNGNHTQCGYIFKDRILDCLTQNEDTHYELLIKHFRKHLEPFNNK